MNKNLSKEVKEKIIKDMIDSCIPDIEYADCSTSASSTDNTFSVEKLNEMIEKLDLKSTPKERTLMATDGKYDTIGVPNMENLIKLRSEFGNLNYEIIKILDSIVMYNSHTISQHKIDFRWKDEY